MPRVALPFVGQAYTARSAQIAAQRAVNCYLEVGQANAPTALIGTPGTVLAATCGTGPIRGGIAVPTHSSITGCFIWVSGSEVYRMAHRSPYGTHLLGTIGTSTGPVGITQNATQVLIVDGDSGYIIDFTDLDENNWPTLSEITDEDFPAGVTQAVYIDGWFIVAGNCGSLFYINESPNDGKVWNGLDFASAEGSPDRILALVANHRELWIFGSNSVEVWIDTGNADFPFERSSNVFIEVGTGAPWSCVKIASTVFWLGSDDSGRGTIYSANGYTPQRISTHAIEYAIASYNTVDDAIAITYQDEGHYFYVLSFPTADATWVYDVASDSWHERSWYNAETEALHRWRASHHCHAFGFHFVGDFESGSIYRLDKCIYTDAKDGATGPIKRIRATQNIQDRQLIQFISMLQVQMGDGGDCGGGGDASDNKCSATGDINCPEIAWFTEASQITSASDLDDYPTTWDLTPFTSSDMSSGVWRLIETSYPYFYAYGKIIDGALSGLPASFTSKELYPGYMEIQVSCLPSPYSGYTLEQLEPLVKADKFT